MFRLLFLLVLDALQLEGFLLFFIFFAVVAMHNCGNWLLHLEAAE